MASRIILALLTVLFCFSADARLPHGGSGIVTSCPFGTSLADGCTGAQAHGTIVDAHLADPQVVNDLSVTGGSGYTNGTFTWTSSGGGCTVNASGSLTVSGGLLGTAAHGVPITGYTITNPGANCTGRPTIAIPGGAGAGTGGSIIASVYQLTPHNCTSVSACNSQVAANWNVSCVDFPCGLDTSLTLLDPTTAGLPSGATFSGSTVTLAGSGGVLNGYDFTLHNTHISVTGNGWTVSNNNFICGAHGTSTGAMYVIQTAVTNVAFKFNTFNGNDTIGGTVCDTSTTATLVNSFQNSGTFLFEYNLCHSVDAKCINFEGNGGTVTITEKYNYYYEIGIAGTTHGEAEYAFFNGSGGNSYTWELGFNVGINRYYVNPSIATSPLAQQADAYALTTNMHHNFAIDRGNQSYTGDSNNNAAPNSAPIFLGEQNDPGTGTITGVATANILDYSGGFFAYNSGSSFGAMNGNVNDFNAGTGHVCTVGAGQSQTCN